MGRLDVTPKACAAFFYCLKQNSCELTSSITYSRNLTFISFMYCSSMITLLLVLYLEVL